ncbi:uncharacterized protein [Dysidea avara]|uniref:uncharacterized protein isoform X1 n=2 Tax=Dysidea avara TaxID=196820 RepID=UPI0033226AF1
MRPCRNKDTGVMNFSACWIVLSDIETDVFGVATDVPGLGIECHEFQVNLLRCIRHSVDGFEQVSSVDCSGIKGVNFQCLLDCVIRYRNKCFWCCDRCSSIVMLTYKKSSLLLELFLVKS